MFLLLLLFCLFVVVVVVCLFVSLFAFVSLSSILPADFKSVGSPTKKVERFVNHTWPHTVQNAKRCGFSANILLSSSFPFFIFFLYFF